MVVSFDEDGNNYDGDKARTETTVTSNGSGPTTPTAFVSDKDAAEQQQQQPSIEVWRAWTTATLLAILNLLNFVDRFSVAGVLTKLETYYDVPDSMGGLIQTVYIAVYIGLAPIVGYTGDRYNRKWIAVIGNSIWVVSMIFSSLVPSHLFWLFMLLRGFNGVGEAAVLGVTPSILGDIFKGQQRGYALMLFYYSIPIGAVMGYVSASAIASIHDVEWQWGIRLVPVIAIVNIILIVLFVVEPPRGGLDSQSGGKLDRDRKKASFLADIQRIIEIPTFWFLVLAVAAVNFTQGAQSWWNATLCDHGIFAFNTTTYFHHETFPEIQAIAGGINVVGGIIGTTGGVALAEFWKSTNWPLSARASPLVGAAGCLLASPFTYGSQQMYRYDIYLNFVAGFIASTFVCVVWVLSMDALLEVVVSPRRATATIVLNMMSHVIGDGPSPYLVGLLSDTFRKGGTSHYDHFMALLKACYISNMGIIVGGICFICSAVFFVADKKRAERESSIT